MNEKDPRPEKGTIVGLKCGGPSMIVAFRCVKWVENKYEPTDEVMCNWFDKDLDIKQRAFDYRLLEIRTATSPYRGTGL